MEQEIWKLLSGFNGDYVVSNLGKIVNVRTKKNVTISTDNHGYSQVKLLCDGERKTYSLHRLIASQFFGKSNLQVNHINGIKTDNRVMNLEFVTPKQNIRHYIEFTGGKYYTKRKIYQYSQGNLVKIWDNIKDMHAYYGGDISDIKKALKNKNYPYLGYMLEYEKSVPTFRRISLVKIPL